MLCVLGKQLFLQSLDAVGIALSVEVGSLLHSCERSPALRIYDISILECLCHGIGLGEAAAGLLSVLLSYFLNLRHYLVSFRMCQNNVHTESGHQADNTLRYGKRFAVARGVSPGHSYFLTL